MRKDFAFPRWLADRVPEDARFADAYDSTAPERRALLKTCIARLWEWWGDDSAAARESAVEYRAGFASRDRITPVDCVLIFIDDSTPSPARLLAGLAPALVSGVPHVLAVHVGSGWSESQLTALELAGQEDVAELDRDEAVSLLSELAGEVESCVALCLGGAMAEEAGNAGMTVWQDEPGPVVVVGEGFDMEAIAFMHPQGVVQVPNSNDIQEKPAGVFSTEPVDASFSAGIGMEACWAFVGMPSDLFLKRKSRWTTGGLS